ncbi:hypothetical protein FMLHJGGC_00049 [Staphylococcus phage BSwM-KMM1]|nr:hypothetical protein FMLHJGGC_00049 [Pseudomonas phage BSwM KMM1]
MYILERTVKGFIGQRNDVLPYHFKTEKGVTRYLKANKFHKKETNCWVKK